MRSELTALRSRMKETGIDLYIIPTTDFHGSEYVNDHFKCREYISGFTGSAGTLVVQQEWAGLWTDGRYFLQAEEQLEGSGITLMKIGQPEVPEITAYVKSQLEIHNQVRNRAECMVSDAAILHEEPEGAPGKFTVGFDGRVMSRSMGEELKDIPGADIVYDIDLAGDIWQERPELTPAEIYQLSENITGETAESKLARVRAEMGDADHLLISRLEDIAWLYNLRGSDVAHTPVFYSFALVSPDDDILYVMNERSMKGITDGPGCVRAYSEIFTDMQNLRDCTVMLDEDSVSYAVSESLDPSVEKIAAGSVVGRLKAVKNDTEIAASRNAHIRDGAAMVEFICWLKHNVADNDLTEMSIAEHLKKCRKRQGALDLSFDTIAGYEEHGAVIHYSATPETDAVLRPEGFVLVDSGGQYEDGTTDITRTIALGEVDQERKKNYTAVLKAHLALAMADFDQEMTGADLDAAARKPLREAGLDFAHGTGHGVGHLLSVHEGPNTISPGPAGRKCHIVPGMITSDEPGVYLAGQYGIRIENEILCIRNKRTEEYSGDHEACRDKEYGFEMLTFCPYERQAMDMSMLTENEIRYIDDYHCRVYELLAPLLDPVTAVWLEEQCRPLK